MLRDCCAYEPLVAFLLEGNVWEFFTYTESSNFDVQSDAFATFREILTVHKAMVAEFLESNYDRFFDEYTKLLSSENYVTRRMSLKLLGELLLDRANFNIMSKYIGDLDNLKRVMNLLRDKSKNIQFEAFHVFKVFVANPNKPADVTHILVKNREKLVGFLTNFQNDKEDDQFTQEKAFLLKQIQSLRE
jgi:calcium binding protein 39